MGHTFPPTLTLLSFKAGIEGPSVFNSHSIQGNIQAFWFTGLSAELTKAALPRCKRLFHEKPFESRQ